MEPCPWGSGTRRGLGLGTGTRMLRQPLWLPFARCTSSKNELLFALGSAEQRGHQSRGCPRSRVLVCQDRGSAINPPP